MKSWIARKTTLYRASQADHSRPVLLGERCVCGYTFFPPHKFGCENCGREAGSLETIELVAQGTLQSVAVIERQFRPDGKQPLIVGEVLLLSGLSIIAVLDITDPSDLSIGQKMFGKLWTGGEDGEGKMIMDCYFSPGGGVA